MSNGKSTVITTYGHGNVIDKIAVSLFEEPESHDDDSNAKTYCDTINSLELQGEAWVFAQIVSENTQYSLDMFHPLRFDILLKLDDHAIQRVLQYVDSQELIKALKGANTEVQDKIFQNMSKRAADMLKEDMEYRGSVRPKDIKEAQKNVLSIVRHLGQTGEIITP
jgi:flagellar motor switch protein FliG